MTRDYHRWYSRSLDRDMELLVFGHGGPPVMVFPSSMGAFFEYEDRGMVGGAAAQARQRLAAALLRVVGRQRELVRQAQCTRGSASSVTCSTSPTSSATSCRSIRQLQSAPGHRRHRLQLRRLPRHGDGAAPSLRVHVVRHDQRRLRHQPVPRRLERPGRLPAQPAVRSCPASATPTTWTSTAATSSCWPPASGTSAGRPTRSFSRLLGAKGIPHSLHVWGYGSQARLAVLAADGQRLSALSAAAAATSRRRGPQSGRPRAGLS